MISRTLRCIRNFIKNIVQYFILSDFISMTFKKRLNVKNKCTFQTDVILMRLWKYLEFTNTAFAFTCQYVEINDVSNIFKHQYFRVKVKH